MEALLRLRVLIWAVVLALWGVMVYQYLGEEEEQPQQMRRVANPYKGMPPPLPEPEPPAPAPPETAIAMINPPSQALSNSAALPSSLDYIKPLPMPPPAARRARTKTRMRHEGAVKRPELPVPPGFIKTVTRHFNVYAEGDPASERFLDTIESLHANLMLDLASFSPWADEEKVTVFLFKDQETYRQVTGRPPWSGGASSVPKRKVYVYESEELPGILAHELCHIYFDGFFLDGRPDPLWLSEGMATLLQVERGLAAPTWLRENLEILEQGGGFSISELMNVTTTAGASDDHVRLWYAQSYSTVRFLIRSQYKSNFFKFAGHLRDGRDVTQALYRAYGMPFNRLKALEYAWRYDLTRNSLSRLSNSPE